jgi:predicted lysophospholipase L1 biosynthesis ABC-type transport system permease subunit
MVEGRPAAIAGVVADVRQAGGRDHPFPEIYLSYRQSTSVGEQASLVIRTLGDPAAFVPELRAIVRGVDPDLPLADVATMDDRLSASVGRPRFYTRLLGAFSGLALCLAATGIYGVLSVDTSRRRRELGIRRALGATDREIVLLVLRRGLRLTAIGLALGLAAALAVSRSLESLLFGVGPTHAPTLAVAFALLGSIALLACYLPARRANRVEPAEALRCE